MPLPAINVETHIDSFMTSATKAAARNVLGIHEVNVLDYGADRTGVADSTAAFQSAVDANAGGKTRVCVPAGNYKITSTVTIAKDRVYIVGDGEWCTQITFAPTANDILFFVGKGGEGSTNAGSVVQGCISDLGIFSLDTTYKKTAIEVKDIGEYRIENVAIGPVGNWAGAGSIGIRSRGREILLVSNVQISADYPIRIAVNTAEPTLCADHFHYRDLYLIADQTGNCITVEDGAILSNTTFDGQQAWVQGTNGLYWETTSGVSISNNVRFENIRTEQHSFSTGYMFNIRNSGNTINGLTFRNCYGGIGINGWYLRGVSHVIIEHCFYVGNSLKAMDIGSTANYIDIRNSFWQTGCTATIDASHILYNAKRLDNAAPLPCTGFFSNGATERNVRTGGPLSEYEVPLVAQNAIATLPIPASAQGMFVITDSEGLSAMMGVRRSNKLVYVVYSDAGIFSGTKDSANLNNVYWDAASSTYKIQNNRPDAGGRRYWVQFFGVYAY